MKKIWEITGTILYAWIEETFTTNCSNFGQIRLQSGQKLVHIISRISRNFSREMGRFFSHLARNPKCEKCAALMLLLLQYSHFRNFHTVIHLDRHISRVLDFSRDARKNDPFLARNCEKCEKRYVPNFGQFEGKFDLNLSNLQSWNNPNFHKSLFKSYFVTFWILLTYFFFQISHYSSKNYSQFHILGW